MSHFQKFVDQIQHMPVEAQIETIEQLRQDLHSLSPLKSQPIDRVKWVPIHRVTSNNYNPNCFHNNNALKWQS